ncbi:MAG: DUF3566 domain-containing protein [Micrococcaceae bacterium]
MSTVKPARQAATGTKFEKVRRARLTLSQVNIGSVVKVALLLSVAMLVMTIIAGLVLLLLMNVTGIMGQINDFAKQVAGDNSHFNIHDIFSVGHVLAVSALIGVINVFLLTAFAAVTAFIYNLASSMVGGVGVTLTDD